MNIRKYMQIISWHYFDTSRLAAGLFIFSRSDCDKRAKVLQGSCEHVDISKPAFTAADSSAAEQSKLCSEAKNRALNNNTAEDMGCGCGLLSGYLSCTYFTISKSRYKGGGGGKSK